MSIRFKSGSSARPNPSRTRVLKTTFAIAGSVEVIYISILNENFENKLDFHYSLFSLSSIIDYKFNKNTYQF